MVLIFFLAPFETDASFGLKIEPCYIEELGEEVLCGTYEVMENRNVRKGAKIRLNFIILPAWTTDPAPDPVFIFSGGPGQGSADVVVHYAQRYEKLRWERDIVLVDQQIRPPFVSWRDYETENREEIISYLSDHIANSLPLGSVK